MVKRGILIGSLSDPYFAKWTDFTDLSSYKGIQKETFWRYVEIFSLLSDQNSFELL